jgi:hypothetical protein
VPAFGMQECFALDAIDFNLVAFEPAVAMATARTDSWRRRRPVAGRKRVVVKSRLSASEMERLRLASSDVDVLQAPDVAVGGMAPDA